MEEEVEQAVPSPLEKLRSPTSSTLARKRKLTKNKPPTGCKKGKGAVAAEPQSITPESRLREFPDKYLCVWSSPCKLILLIQPSSAAAERVFSLLSSSFKEQQATVWRTTLRHP